MKAYFSSKIPLIEAEIEKIVPRKATGEWFGREVDDHGYDFDTNAWDKAIADPFYHMFDSGGKRFRPVLSCLMHDVLGGDSSEIYRLSTISEMIHSGTLIVDDIEDRSELRRGKSCVHKVYGEGIAVNCGNFLVYYAQKIVRDSRVSDAEKIVIYNIISEELTKLHIGQGMDIWWGENEKFDINMDQYLLMTSYKTGALLNVALNIGAVLAGGESKYLFGLSDIANKMGIAFQIKDDILNLKPGKTWGKETGEDITEGKITYLVVYALKNSRTKDKKRLQQILRSKTKNKQDINEAIEIMQGSKSFDAGLEFAKELIVKAKDNTIKLLDDNKYRKVFLEILDYCVEREK
ncbi:polyprenyl synthetase family protein [Patescibacteria group bacterium]|nr:polyprenyl synthetase family protein [Patescibacteria group bacterium]